MEMQNGAAIAADAEKIRTVSGVLEKLLPVGIVAIELTGDGDPALLLDDERKLMQGAVRKRLHEFAAGRYCARRAIARFGIADFPIVTHGDRRPRWPSGLTGSITHTAGFSAAAVGELTHFQAIGIDAERVAAMSAEVWNQVLLPAEIRRLQSLRTPAQATAAALTFSAKEAFYKCQYEVTGQWLEFTDVEVELSADLSGGDFGSGCFAVRPVREVTLFARCGAPAIGRFVALDDLVLTAMALSAH